MADEDYDQPLPIRLSLSLDSLEEVLLEHYLDDLGVVHTPRYDAATRQIIIDVDLVLESGMTAGSWREHLGQTFVDVPFKAETRDGADADLPVVIPKNTSTG